MQEDLQRILVSRSEIATRIESLGQQITRDLEADGLGSDEITLVPILTGSIIFVSDLIRCLPLRMQIHVMSVTSYPGTSTTSRGAKLDPTGTQVPGDLSGRHVLVMDDILDSGNTLRLVKQELEARGPASVRTCVMLRKQRPEAMAFDVDYIAFDIPDEFVVGYGLDYDDYYRNLPDIAVLKPDVIQQGGAD